MVSRKAKSGVSSGGHKALPRSCLKLKPGTLQLLHRDLPLETGIAGNPERYARHKESTPLHIASDAAQDVQEGRQTCTEGRALGPLAAALQISLEMLQARETAEHRVKVFCGRSGVAQTVACVNKAAAMPATLRTESSVRTCSCDQVQGAAAASSSSAAKSSVCASTTSTSSPLLSVSWYLSSARDFAHAVHLEIVLFTADTVMSCAVA